MILASHYRGCVPASDFQEWGCLGLDADATLCEGAQAFHMTVVVERSNVALQCRGQVIEHLAGVPRPGVRFPKTRSLDHVTIEGCSIRNTGHAAIEMLRNFRDVDGSSPGHHNVTIRDVSVDSAKFGVYIGTRSHDISLERVRIHSAAEVGVYVDADSDAVTLSEVEVASTRAREGIAVDSATGVVIEDGLTRDNRGGGIRLYHNCGELRGSVCPVSRASGASRNIIRGNRIEDGVIVASRQGERYAAGLCADLQGQAGAMRDVAQGNQIVDNVFVAPARWASLSIHDGPNTVLRNRFVRGEGPRCLALHLAPVAYGGARPPGVTLQGTTIAENDFGDCEARLTEVEPQSIDFGVNYGARGVCVGLPSTAACYVARPASQ
jgi:hypothetical protein